MNPQNEPQLAAPGAGLPPIELFFARVLMRTRARLGNREKFRARFLSERASIARLVKSCPSAQRERRVLIRRCPGLEDSSRYWSIWMTLDHLRIVNHEIASVLSALSQGTVPAREASTAAVKPSPEVTSEVLATYELSCSTLLTTADGIGELRTKKRYPHPWFGPMDAAAWFSLAGGHMAIHRTQIEGILQQG